MKSCLSVVKEIQYLKFCTAIFVSNFNITVAALESLCLRKCPKILITTIFLKRFVLQIYFSAHFTLF